MNSARCELESTSEPAAVRTPDGPEELASGTCTVWAEGIEKVGYAPEPTGCSNLPERFRNVALAESSKVKMPTPYFVSIEVPETAAPDGLGKPVAVLSQK